MQKFVLVLGALGALLIVVSAVMIFRFSYDPPPYSGIPYEVPLGEAETRAELDRLAGLRDGELPASLGAIAGAAADCAVASMGKRPEAAVQQAARRFFLVFFAMKNRADSPLIDPRMAEISLEGPPSVQGLTGVWLKSESKATADRWGWVLGQYADVSHPIYTGIAIDPGGWDAADLDHLFRAVQVAGDTVVACYRRRAGG